MPSPTSIHVIPTGDGSWAIRKSAALKNVHTFGVKADAVKVARTIAKEGRTEMYVHRSDGIVTGHSSYVPPSKK